MESHTPSTSDADFTPKSRCEACADSQKNVAGTLFGLLVLVFFIGMALVQPVSSEMLAADQNAYITDSLSTADEPIAEQDPVIAATENTAPVETENTDAVAYRLRGNDGTIRFETQESALQILEEQKPRYTGNIETYYRAFVLNDALDEYLMPVVNGIAESAGGDDDDARIAISLVQHLPYSHIQSSVQSPYGTLINGGDCDDKSVLLAYLLQKMGYGVALFYFEEEKHMTVGIRCDDAFAYQNSGYCFVEASKPSIPTDDGGNYVNSGQLTSTPEIITVRDGDKFGSVDEEFTDAQRWDEIRTAIRASATDSAMQDDWRKLNEKYWLQ